MSHGSKGSEGTSPQLIDQMAVSASEHSSDGGEKKTNRDCCPTSVSEYKTWGFLLKQYIKLVLFRAMAIWPSLLICLFGLPSVIYFVGRGPAWMEYQNMF
jgi:hypothetical protein